MFDPSGAVRPPETVILYGAGGHGRVVLDALLCLGGRVEAVIDDEPRRWGTELLGVPVLGAERIPGLRDNGVGGAVLGIGDNDVRVRLGESLRLAGFRLPSVVHPSAVVSVHANLREGAVILAGGIVNAGAEIGFCAVVNTGATVDHDCSVGVGSFLGPGCHLGGEVAVGERAFLGVGAAVRPRVRIGSRSIIGVGAAVVGDIPPNVVAVGVPARILKARAEADE